uniref:Uncharacterized protein n=2 Tax=Amphimedon queenslandica TaxID=400682 RepID=A0A1X7SXL9_AMPQE
LLGNGGHGNGSIIYPCLLPLLSQLLKVPDCDTTGLSINFITRLKSGLSSEVSKGSLSDTNSLIMSLIECSSYCIDTNDGGDTSGVTPFISHLINIIIELIDDLFLVPAVQLEGVSNCIVWLINLLVKRSVRYQSDMTHLDQLRSELTHRLCQRLTMSDTVKQSLNSISTLLVKFYPQPTSATPTIVPPTSPLTLISPSTSQYMLPLTCELISDCLTRYSNSLSHIKLASSLLSAISHMTSSWVDHVTRLVGCPYKEGVEGDAHYSLAKYLIELLNSGIEVESGKEVEKWGVSVGGVSPEMLAWSFSDIEMREELLVDCCVNVLYAGRGGERGGVNDVHGHVLSTESVRKMLLEICQ